MMNVVVLNPCCEEFQKPRQRYVGAAPHGVDVAAVVGLPRLVASFEGVLQVEQQLTCSIQKNLSLSDMRSRSRFHKFKATRPIMPYRCMPSRLPLAAHSTPRVHPE